MDSETSQSTGRPIWESRSGDDNLGYMVLDKIDDADAELAAYDEEQSKKDEKVKGLSRWVQPVMRDGSGVPEGGLAREHWMEMMAEQHEAEQQMIADMGAMNAEVADLIGRPGEPGFNPADYGDGIVG